MSATSLGMTPTVKNSASYIASWKSRIQDIKPSDFSDACRSAEQAYRTIFNITQQKDD